MTADEDIERLRLEAGLDKPLAVLEPIEKTMMGGKAPTGKRTRPMGAGSGKPHYTRLMVYPDRYVLAVGCCKPLSVIDASVDGNPVDGKTILSKHSEENGGKMLLEFRGQGEKLAVDVRRGESERFQRLVFEISNLVSET